MRTRLLLLMSVLILAGCSMPLVASLEKKPAYVLSQNSPKGVIYFYREGEFAGSVRGMYIDVNGERVGALNSGTYFVYEADPGQITVAVEDSLSEKDPTRTIKVEAGKVYYVKGTLKMGIWDAVPAISLVMPEEGEGAVKQLTYATMKEKDLKAKK